MHSSWCCAQVETSQKVVLLFYCFAGFDMYYSICNRLIILDCAHGFGERDRGYYLLDSINHCADILGYSLDIAIFMPNNFQTIHVAFRSEELFG